MRDFHEEEILGKAYDARLMRRLLKYAKPYRWALLLSVVLLMFVAAADLARPWLVQVAIDNYITPGPQVVFEPGEEPVAGTSYQGKIYVPEHQLSTEHPDRPRAQLILHAGDYYLVGAVLTRADYQVEERDGELLFVTPEAEYAGELVPADVYQDFREWDIRALVQLALIFLVVIVLGFVMNVTQVYILHRTGQKIIYNMRVHIFSHMQKLSLRFFDTNPVGRLVTRVTNDTETLNEMFTGVLVNLFKDVFILLGIVLVMLRMNTRLALLSFSILPVILVATVIFRMKARDAYREVRTRLAQINATLQENISGMRIVQIFNREKKKFNEFNDINTAYYRATFREILVFAIFRPFIDILYFIALAALIWFGGGDVIRGTLEFGVLYAFVNYIQMFFQPINDMAEKYNILQAAMASSERIFQLLDTEPEIVSPEEPKSADIEGRIEFKNVWFAYNPGEWVLRDVSFTVDKGQTVAFVGATGAGKTSIISLLSRLYDIQKGQILIDGVDIRELELDELRQRIAVVLQDVFIFSGTIAENIRLNNEEINDQRIQEIAAAVDADRFISRLPKGYESEVQERGSTMSAGQRQLLAFARALAFDPKILVLDEATANIDTETEQTIQRAMRTISQGRTTIVVAHRLSTIQNADKIIVLHKGKIREEGSHQELLAREGMYYHLYQLQFREQEGV
ncbi:MAG: ABC transporter ATP-binding protein [Firmicutes bacterium]|nr:ABC transporter ATP-binding protein [Bacillota bacterium]